MGLRHKLFLSLALLVAPNLMVLLAGMNQLNRVDERLLRINTHLMPSLRILQRLQQEVQVATQLLDLKFYQNVDAAGFPQPWEQHLRKIQTHLEEISSVSATSRGTMERLQQLRKHLQERNTRQLLTDVTLLTRWFDREIGMETLLTQRELKSALNGLLITLIFSISLSLVVFYLVRKHAHRLQNLVTLIQAAARGHYRHALTESAPFYRSSPDEIETVGRELKSMVVQLEQREERLTAQHRQLQELLASNQEAKEKLVQSERLAAVGQMSAQIAHEIRNPLNAMSLHLELLEEQLVDQDQTQRHVRVLLEEIQRLERLTHHYLEAAQLRPSALPTPREQDSGEFISIAAALERTQDLFQEAAHQRGITLRVQADTSGRELRPSDKVMPVLINLIRNSLTAVDKDGTIELGVEATSGRLRVWVEDSGPGISVHQRDHVLQPFVSLSPTGTGLGFSIIQKNLESLGGRLEIKDPRRLTGVRIECDLGETRAS